MYCILNQSNDIIASDLEFLKLFKTNSLVELYKKITSKDVKISLDYDKITLTIDNNLNIYDIKVTPLTTLFGKSVLIQVMRENIKNEFIKAPAFTDMPPINKESKDTLAKVNMPKETIEPIVTSKEEITSEPIYTEKSAKSSLEVKITKNTSTQESKPEENRESFVDPNITLDILDIAKSMYLSENDYRIFLNEYISSIDKLKNDLLGDNEETKDRAFNFIKHLTTTLHLPKEIIDLVNSLKANSSKELLQNFFDVIDNIKEQNLLFLAHNKEETIQEIAADKIIEETAPLKEIQIIPVDEESKSINTMQDLMTSTEIQIEPEPTLTKSSEIDIKTIELETLEHPTTSEPEQKIVTQESSSNAKIDLENVKPLPFDFILDESAKELSLPTDIVKEFIKDFIEQCRIDTDKIINEYKKGDIEKIKKLAHSLKGVASNLYIKPLADTLLELQNNNDLSGVKPLVEKYWGQFLYLENIMKNI